MKTYRILPLLGSAIILLPLVASAHPGPHEEVSTLPTHLFTAPDHLLGIGLILLIGFAAFLIRRAVSGRGRAE